MSRGGRKKREEAADRLPPGDYVFLSFLLYGPMSAYDVKKAMAGSVAHFWSTAHSQVYQQASRLLRDGYLKEKEQPEGRRRKVLSLTPRGRREVVRWLREPASREQLFSEMLVKTFFAPQAGDLEATRRMLEHELEEALVQLEDYEGLMSQIRDVEALRYPAMTLDMGIRVSRAWIEWLREALEVVEKDIAGDG